MKNKNIIRILIVISILLLLIAFSDNPYGYYQFLRWFVCGTAVYSVYLLFQKIELNNNNKSFNKNYYYLLIFIYSLVAIIYNPISPFYLNRETWGILNLITILTFLFLLIKFSKINLKLNKKIIITITLIILLSLTTLIIYKKETKCLEIFTFKEVIKENSNYKGKNKQWVLYGDLDMPCEKNLFDDSDFCSYEDKKS